MHRYTDDCDDFVNQRPSRSRSISADYRHDRSRSEDRWGNWGNMGAPAYSSWNPNYHYNGNNNSGMQGPAFLGKKSVVNIKGFGRPRSSSVSSSRSVTGRHGGRPPPQPLQPAVMPQQPVRRRRSSFAPIFAQPQHQQQTPRGKGKNSNKKGQKKNNKGGKKTQQKQKQQKFTYQWETSYAAKALINLSSLMTTMAKKEGELKPEWISAKEKITEKLPEYLEKLAKTFEAIATRLGVEPAIVTPVIKGVRTDSLDHLKEDWTKLKGLLNHLSKEQKYASDFSTTAKRVAAATGVTIPPLFNTFEEIVKGVNSVEIKSLQQFLSIAPFILFKQKNAWVIKNGKPHNRSKKEFMELINTSIANGSLKVADIEGMRMNAGFNEALLSVMHYTYSLLEEGKRIKEYSEKESSNMNKDTMTTRQKMLVNAYKAQSVAATAVATTPEESRMPSAPAVQKLQNVAERDQFLYSMMYPGAQTR